MAAIGEDADYIAPRYQEVAQRHGLTIIEVYRMVRVALFGPEALDDKFDPFGEWRAEMERDSALLDLSLPIEQALLIWQHAHDGLRRVVARWNASTSTTLVDVPNAFIG